MARIRALSALSGNTGSPGTRESGNTGVREHRSPGTRRSRNTGQGTARVLPGRDRAVRLPTWRQGRLADAGLVTETAGRRKERNLMNASLIHQRTGVVPSDQTRTLFAQTMGYVAVTAALFALGAYLGRNLSSGVGFIAFIAAFACLIGMRFAARRSASLTVGLLAAFGLLIGLGLSMTLAYYASADPRALWEAGGATALFIAGFGAAGYATRRDLSVIARVCFWALLALIAVGIVLIFVHIPGGELIYSVLGLVIFAGFTMYDFQRLRRSADISSAPFLAASIFLDVLNVFLFFVQIFSGGEKE